MDLYVEFHGLIEMLNRNGVDYAVCGGIAVAVHGYPRFTYDIDLLIQPHDLPEAIIAAKSCGFVDETGRIPLGPCVAHRIVKMLDNDHLVLDLVLVSDVLEPVWESRVEYHWQDQRLSVVSASGLAMMKRMSGREQDLLDVKMLEGKSKGDQQSDPDHDS